VAPGAEVVDPLRGSDRRAATDDLQCRALAYAPAEGAVLARLMTNVEHSIMCQALKNHSLRDTTIRGCN
jgi:hypothetical protein